MKIVHQPRFEPGVVRVGTTTSADAHAWLVEHVGIGNPFLAFDTVSNVVEAFPGADFTGAPLVSADADANSAAVSAMLSDPPTAKVWVA